MSLARTSSTPARSEVKRQGPSLSLGPTLHDHRAGSSSGHQDGGGTGSHHLRDDDVGRIPVVEAQPAKHLLLDPVEVVHLSYLTSRRQKRHGARLLEGDGELARHFDRRGPRGPLAARVRAEVNGAGSRVAKLRLRRSTPRGELDAEPVERSDVIVQIPGEPADVADGARGVRGPSGPVIQVVLNLRGVGAPCLAHRSSFSQSSVGVFFLNTVPVPNGPTSRNAVRTPCSRHFRRYRR